MHGPGGGGGACQHEESLKGQLCRGKFGRADLKLWLEPLGCAEGILGQQTAGLRGRPVLPSCILQARILDPQPCPSGQRSYPKDGPMSRFEGPSKGAPALEMLLSRQRLGCVPRPPCPGHGGPWLPLSPCNQNLPSAPALIRKPLRRGDTMSSSNPPPAQNSPKAGWCSPEPGSSTRGVEGAQTCPKGAAEVASHSREVTVTPQGMGWGCLHRSCSDSDNRVLEVLGHRVTLPGPVLGNLRPPLICLPPRFGGRVGVWGGTAGCTHRRVHMCSRAHRCVGTVERRLRRWRRVIWAGCQHSGRRDC